VKEQQIASSMVLGFDRSDLDKIQFSICVKIARLENHDDQDIIIKSVLDSGLRKQDA